MTAKVVNITLLSLSMLSTLTVSSQSVEIKRPKFHNSIHTERYLSPSEKISDYLYYNGFGREIMHSTNGMGSGNYIVHTFKEYGADGNLLKEYLPITTDMFHRPDAIDFPLKSVEQYSDSEGYTDYTYDVLGRTTAIRKAGVVWKNHPCKISYSTNDSDEVKHYCLENMESQMIRIREKSNEKFLLKHRSPLLDGNFWKKLKDFIEHKVDVYERKDNNKFRLD